MTMYVLPTDDLCNIQDEKLLILIGAPQTEKKLGIGKRKLNDVSVYEGMKRELSNLSYGKVRHLLAGMWSLNFVEMC